MSNAANLYLPPHVHQMLQETADEVESMTERQKGKMLPQPTGYKMLLILPEQEKSYGDTGIVKADVTVRADEVSSVVAFVAALGPDCYKDEVKFPSGPWCKQGDFVIIRPYSGVRVMVHGKEMRLVNDDSIEAVVDDPRGIKRVGG